MRAKMYCPEHSMMEQVKTIEFINDTMRIHSTKDCIKVMTINRIQELITDN